MGELAETLDVNTGADETDVRAKMLYKAKEEFRAFVEKG